MEIILHRCNTIKLLNGLPKKYGAEIDLRSYKEEIIIHHDPYEVGINFKDWLKHYKHGILILNLKEDGLEEKVLKSDKPVLVDFWAEWCGPCRMVGPIIDELSKEFEGKAVIGKIDVDSNQEFAAKYGVRNIPTVLLFKDGELVSRQVGVAPKKTYEDAINAAL